MNPLSKLQSEAVLELKEFYDADGTLHIGGERLIKLETMVSDQIQKAYSNGREEMIEEIWNLVDKLSMPVGRRELEQLLQSLKQK